MPRPTPRRRSRSRAPARAAARLLDLALVALGGVDGRVVRGAYLHSRGRELGVVVLRGKHLEENQSQGDSLW